MVETSVSATATLSELKQSLGDRMKSYEHTETVPPYLPFIVRADGKSFSKYTHGLEQPFDDRFQLAMVRTANGLLEFFNAQTVFVCSDEITLVFDRLATRKKIEQMADKSEQTPVHIYNGRRFKIETLVATKASVLFNRFMLEEVEKTLADQVFAYNQQVVERVQQCDAIFDARLMVFVDGKRPEDSNDAEIVNNLIWRSCYECHRNAVSTYARFHLGKKDTFKKNSSEMIAMMKEKGFDWEKDVPIHYKYGVYGKKEMVALTNEKGGEYTRGRVVNFSLAMKEMPMEKAVQMILTKYMRLDHEHDK